jgi:hypothetical protein
MVVVGGRGEVFFFVCGILVESCSGCFGDVGTVGHEGGGRQGHGGGWNFEPFLAMNFFYIILWLGIKKNKIKKKNFRKKNYYSEYVVG